MAIKFHDHAIRRLTERRIRRVWVEVTITAPDWTAPDPDDPSVTRAFRAIANAQGRILRVVHRPDGADILVLTAFFDRGAKRP
jgi:hypothetical protein